MLIDFTMRNFKSFKNETVLSAETGERLSRFKDSNTIQVGHIDILKNLLIFGPNGSGKSNLLDGLKTMKSIVMNPLQTISQSLPANRFRLSPNYLMTDTFFEVIFSRKEIIYKYSFSFNTKKFTHEKLDIWNKTKWTSVFSRKKQIFSNNLGKFQDIATKTNQNRLFLFDAQSNNNTTAIEVFKWFSEDLIFVDDFVEDRNISDMAILLNEPLIHKQFLKFLRFADLNINDIDIIEENSDYDHYMSSRFGKISDIDPPKVNHIYTEHKIYDAKGELVGKTKFRLTDESRGTQKIFMIALAFINAEVNGNGKTILFDEFDDSLHLELSKAMIQIFNSKANKNQFIITTHELQLLDSNIRVDQMYLVQKDFQGLSSLVSIFDFKDTKNTTRSGISYMKRYMQGRFGAAPVIDPEEMLTALTKIHSFDGENEDD